MSMELWVALPVGEAATTAGIVAEARHLGFELGLSDATVFDDELAGFQPGSLDGEPAGAEMQLFDRYEAPDMAEAFGERAGAIGRIIVFSWGGSFIEGAFASVCAAALVAGSNGVCFDPDEDAIQPVERIVEIAHSLLSEARKTAAG